MIETSQALRIHLHGDPVATITRYVDAGGTPSFDLIFESSWINRLHRPILSLAALNWRLPYIRRFRRRLPPFLTNLLPEREGALRRRISRAAGLDQNDDFGLLAFVGRDMSGAITAEQTEPIVAHRRVHEIPAATELDTSRMRWSLGGMQLKFSVDRTDRITLPIHGRGGRWILKLPEPGRPDLPRAELAAMAWARAAGFEVPEMEIVDPRMVDGLPLEAVEGLREALLVRRFDRQDDHRPIHMEEMASVVEAHPEDKYAEASSPHAAKHLVYLGRIVRRFAGEEGLRTFLGRVIFDVVVGNGDAHLKNWAFLFPDARTPRLAPVYDVVPTILFGLDPELALSFAGGRSFRSIDETRVRAFAVKVGASPAEMVNVARDTVSRAVDTFDAAMASSGLEPQRIGAIRRHWESLPIVCGSNQST